MRRLTISILVIIIAGAAFFVYQRMDSNASEPPVARQTARAAMRSMSATVLATGTIRPRVGAEVKVGARISGQVTRLYVTVGSRVREGQVIAELDQTELLARRAQASASIDLERASAASVRRTAERASALYKKQLISDEENDQANETRTRN